MRRIRIILSILLLVSGSISAKGLRLFTYPADSATNTGIAVIVCPGGSYCWHDMEHEGREVAQWLQSNGINAFVLQYRVATISAYCIGYPVYPVVTMRDKQYTHHRSRRGALGVWGQFNKTMRDSLSLEQHIPADCPPVFLVNCVDDPIVKYHNSEMLDSALTAQHIPHRYIQYRTGGHGFGASDEKGTEECRQWKNECLQWILNLNQ